MLAEELVKLCPFYDNESGSICTKWKATWDRVFVWQPLAPSKVGNIVLPDIVRNWNKPQIGVVLSAGRGWYDDKKFYPTILKPGWVVVFDIRTPWYMKLEGIDGNMYEIRYMGEQDVRCIVSMDQDIDGIGQLICSGNFMKRSHRLGGSR